MFGQLEYKKDKLSAFLTGAVNSTSNQRIDRMIYDSNPDRGEASEVVVIGGYSFKGGANYNLNDNHNVYVNAGKFSRAPFFSFVFVNNTNDVVQNLLNEKATSFEAGYGYTSRKLSAKVNTTHRNSSFCDISFIYIIPFQLCVCKYNGVFHLIWKLRILIFHF